MTGTVYLLCFSAPYRGARHYLGWTARTVENRLQDHLSGKGNGLVHAAHRAGRTIEVVRTWPGTGHDEQKLKDYRYPAKLCPRCSPGLRERQNARQRQDRRLRRAQLSLFDT